MSLYAHLIISRLIQCSTTTHILYYRFYYPHGKPQLSVAADRTLQRIITALDAYPNRQPDRVQFGAVVEACGLPRYWRMPLFACAQLDGPNGPADAKRFIEFWKE